MFDHGISKVNIGDVRKYQELLIDKSDKHDRSVRIYFINDTTGQKESYLMLRRDIKVLNFDF